MATVHKPVEMSVNRSQYYEAKLIEKEQLLSPQKARELHNFMKDDKGYSPNTLTTNPRKPARGMNWFDMKWAISSLCKSLRCEGPDQTKKVADLDCKLVIVNAAAVKAVLEGHVEIEREMKRNRHYRTCDLDGNVVFPAETDLKNRLPQIFPNNMTNGDVPRPFFINGFNWAAFQHGDTSKVSLMLDNGFSVGLHLSNELFGIPEKYLNEITRPLIGNSEPDVSVLDPKMLILMRSANLPNSPAESTEGHKKSAKQVISLLTAVYGSVDGFLDREKEFINKHSSSLAKVGVNASEIISNLQKAAKVFLTKESLIPNPVFNKIVKDNHLSNILRDSQWKVY